MFEIYQSAKNGEFYFRLKASNGEIILSSQGYKTRGGCRNGIKSVQNHAADTENFIIKKSKSGKHFFNLRARNGQVIGSSQMYASDSGLKNGIKSISKNAPKAKIQPVG